MPSSTNAGLPPELLAIIVTEVTPTDVYWHPQPAQRRRAKHQLVDLSLVCKHWSEVISPYLFRELVLRGRDDLLFLRAIVDSEHRKKTPLGEIVEVLEVHQDAAEAESWLVHLHWLSTRLRKAQLRCTVCHTCDASAESLTVAPFRALPSLPPSYVRLTMLSLRGLTFASLPELRRLVHTFTTLRWCRCEQLTIVDSSPIVRARRTRRNASATLESFSIASCRGTSLYAITTVAFSILGTSPHWKVDSHAWDTVVRALAGLVNMSFRCVEARRCTWDDMIVHLLLSEASARDNNTAPQDVHIAIHLLQPAQIPPNMVAHPAHIEKLVVTCRLLANEDLDYHTLEGVVDLPFFRTLRFEADRRDRSEYKSMRRLLSDVLRGMYFGRALEFGKLQFGFVDDTEDDAISKAEIRAVPATHTVYSTVITLDVDQQAEWLLCDGDYGRREYLQALRDALATSLPIETTFSDEDRRTDDESDEFSADDGHRLPLGTQHWGHDG